jgi:glycosyltransferase involved in cell wall biosynthesis
VLRRDDLLFAPANLVPPVWRGRTVLVIYDTLPWSLPETFPWHVRWRFGGRYRLAARRATRVLVPSYATAREVASVHGIAASRLRVVFPGPEPSFRPLPHDAREIALARRSVGLGDEPFFLFVGKRSRRRNVPAIVEAFARHRQAHPAHRLVFVGPGGGAALPAEPSSLTGIVSAGHVSEEVLRGLLADARALLYPSDHEGFGLPVIEAMASGCPVVTLRNSALTEAGGDAACYLDSAEPSILAQAMETLASDDAIRAAHVARGLAHAALFSRSRFAAAVKDELRSTAFEGAGRSLRGPVDGGARHALPEDEGGRCGSAWRGGARRSG